MRPLRIAVPSKGRMAEPSYRLLHDAGFDFEPDGRRLRVPLPDQDAEILFARADDIPVWVEDRAVDVGIAGANQVAESGVAVTECLRLGFGRCRLVFAAPATTEITSAGDLAGVRIATSYPATVGRYLAERGISATCIPITGSVELAPSLAAAEAIADLVSSGETLRQNGLRAFETVLESEAVLLAPAGLDPATEQRVADLVLVLRSVLAARPKRYLMLNAHDDHLQDIVGLLPGLDAPTVLPLARDGMHAVHAVVDAADVVRLLAPLKQAGATGILVLPIEHLIP